MGKLAKALEKTVPDKNKFSTAIISKGQEPQDNSTAQPSVSAANVFSDGTNITLTSRKWDERLQLTITPTSPVAESFRRLRIKILHPSTEKSPKTILITSVMPGEGKSFICANLGISLAQGMEHHALLVDCDLRKPSLAGLFGIDNNSGLTDYLQNDVELARLIRKTGMNKLSLIPAGIPPDNPADLLDSKKMIKLIDELASRYDDRLILLDSPPNIAASETAILAQRVDGVVLVVRWGDAGRQQVKKLTETIGSEKIIGVVFNGIKESEVDYLLNKKDRYGYYNKYYQQ